MSDDFQQAVARINGFKENDGPIGQAHKHCSNNRGELARSKEAGCFYCCEIYAPSQIDTWTDDDSTAICPKCGIDAVIGEASSFPVTDKAFLKAMNEAWF